MRKAGLKQVNGDNIVWMDGDYYHFNKNEFIAINTWQIQKLKKRVCELEQKFNTFLEN